ncbi:hypothetical protein [Dyadobacter psychrotolerans]|uniref:Uncharacterized protein n=1 Tax=Dyadobacter psychrotolerans TaxID=2541721 RepID=A0A4V2Z4W7_9BACT|nr:hypothetical protein [Dyadobacter psychrotolerans]TDE18358.1 hypothetical protein E0F88_02110 [Dyadobacter psychrotolerans]
MERRKFISLSGKTLCALPVFSSAVFSFGREDKMPDWLVGLVKRNDTGVESLLTYQVQEKNSPDLGGVKDGYDILNPHSTAAIIQWGACAIFSPDSKFYQSDALLSQMRLAAMYLLKIQHKDGTIDLLSTNFHSTPDTGFLVKRLAIAYTLLERSGAAENQKVLIPLKEFLMNAGEALIAGGIHTPNHRWVVSAALTKLNELWPDIRYVDRINQWLDEHIDIDIDGQFNEKSTFIYSSLTDRLLITIAAGLNKPDLLESVRKNLNMTLYYVHPNGEIVTDASGRQDKAAIGTLENYYYPYRYLAMLDKNTTYSAMCKMIEETAGPKIGGFLDYLLADASLWEALPPVTALPLNYVKSFPNSGLVRIRKNRWDSTLIANNPVWFTFMKGRAVLQGVRFASSFFGKGQFQSAKLEQKGNSWELTQTLDGPYFQPYPKEGISPDGDWEKMPKLNRPQSEIQYLETKVTIREIKEGMEVEIVSGGTDGVPAAIELIFRPGGDLKGPLKIEGSKDSWILKEGMGTYTFEKDTITFGPGLSLHKNTVLRGSLPVMDAPSVFLTGFTPFKHTIKFS